MCKNLAPQNSSQQTAVSTDVFWIVRELNSLNLKVTQASLNLGEPLRVRICPIDYPDNEVEGFEWEYAQRLYDQF